MNLWVAGPCWLVSAAFTLVFAYIVHRPLRSTRPAIDAAAYVFLWIFVTTFYTLAAGLAGLLRPIPLAMIALVGLGLLSAIPSTRRMMIDLPLSVHPTVRFFRAWWSDLPAWLRWATAAYLAFSVFRFGFLIVVLPPFVWDSLTYHLTNVAHWTQAGRIELFSTPIVRIYTAANYETLATWFTVFIHHDLVVEAAGLPAYVLALLAIYALARELGLSRKSSWLGSLTYGAMPALLLAVTGTKNDPHMAAYFLMCLAIIAGLLQPTSDAQSRSPLGQLLLLALAVMFAFGTKAYMLHLSLGLVAFALIGAWLKGRWGVWIEVARKACAGFQAQQTWAKLALVAIFAGGLFLGGYWNVRNWVLKGNPFYPYGVAIGGANVLPEGDRTARLNLSRLEGNLQSLAERFGDTRQAIVPDLPYTTGWGWFAYGLGIPALIWGLFRKRKMRGLAVAFSVALLAIFLSDRPSPWNMRYVIWFPALFSLAFAEWADDLSRLGGRLTWTVMSLTGLTVALNFAMTLNYGVVRPGQFQQMLERSVWDRQSATLKVNMPAEYENALVYVPKDALLGYNVSSNGFVYPLYRADFSQHIIYVPFSPTDSCGAVVEKMESRGTRYLFVAPEHTPDDNIALLRECSEIPRSGLRQRARGVYVINYGP